MTTKKLLLTILISISTLGLLAQNADDVKKVKASLNEVTVFFRGAELTHRASASVVKGINDIWITDLSPNIDINSLKINTTKGVILSSFEYSQDFITTKSFSSVEKSLRDSVAYYESQLNEIDIIDKTNKDVLELLKANKNISGANTGLNVTDLMKMVEFYTSKSRSLNREQIELEKQKTTITKVLAKVKEQLLQESAKNKKSMGILKLNLNAPMATTGDFTITYYTQSASWLPYHDINVSASDEKVEIATKAKVSQITGLDWNKVKLALSTATPSTNTEAPLFSAWFLDFEEMAYESSGQSKLIGYLNRPSLGIVQNSYSYETDENIRIRGVSTLSASTTPLYVINGVIASPEEMVSLDSNSINNIEVLKDASATSLYGSRAANGVVLVTTKTIDDFINRTDGELNVVFNIDLPYTIAGNGKVQNLDLQTRNVDANFKHYAVPKLDNEVFVLAEISNWQDLGLLTGKTNVTFDGTYVGESVINTNSIMATLALTLGADKRVSVKREQLKDYSSKKFLGRDIQQDFMYKITVKNNQNRAIKMVLKDQYPLTSQKDIQVDRSKDTTPATHINEEVGVLNWNFELKAGETKEFKVGYSVKYPKDKNIDW